MGLENEVTETTSKNRRELVGGGEGEKKRKGEGDLIYVFSI